MFTAEVTASGIRVVDASGSPVTVSATDRTPADATEALPRSTDDTVGVRVSELDLPPAFVRVTRLDGDETYTVSTDAASPTDGGAVVLSGGDYLVRVDGDVFVYARFDAPARLTAHGDGARLAFDGPTPVTFGLRDRDDRFDPITVPRTVEGVATALSLLPAGHRTTTPDRSFPRLRGRPPRIRFGEELSIPQSVAAHRSQSDVDLVVPQSLCYLVTGASLVHYLGANVAVEPRATPRLELPDRTYELGHQPAFQREAAALLRRVFFLDCLVRGATGETRLAESHHLTTLGLDAADLYSATIAERVTTYLDVPFEQVDDALPEWHLSMYVDPTFENVRTIPHLLANLPNLFLPESTPLTGQERLSRSLDAFYRFEGTGDVAGVDPLKPDLGPGINHGWLADGVPIDVFKAHPAAYEHRAAHQSARESRDDLSVVAVLNDPSMAAESDLAERIYRDESVGVDIDVTIRERLTTAELADVFETRHDFVHFIGHCEDAGLRCPDGYLDTSTLAESKAETFFLNACGSFYEGLELVKRGSVAGAVTFDKVLDDHATRVGTAFARLLVHGFSIERALALARRRIVMGKDYAVVGDGTHTLAGSATRVPVAVTVTQRDDGRYRVELDSQSPRVVGGEYRPPVTGADGVADAETVRLLGSTHEATLTPTELRTFLDRASVPVIFAGDIHWADELLADGRL